MASQRKRTVLIVEDDEALAASLRRSVERIGCTVRIAHTLEEARLELEVEPTDLALIDYFLPDGAGADLVRWAMPAGRIERAICITASASTNIVVEAMRAGFADVCEKPVDFERLRKLLGGPPAIPAEVADWKDSFETELIGEDERLLGQLQLVQAAADTDCTILITGETGTGKELVASLVHQASPRREGPFVTLNCAAIPEALIEAELFGHTKGAFTGADRAREGRIAAANGGTLFLDEVGDLPLAAQAKLLRVLQNRTVMSVGADRESAIDVRVVAATHRDLEAMVDSGEFRADLLFRLSVIPVELPPLRERRVDVLRLARHFIRKTNQRCGRAVEGLDASAEEVLLAHTWPGNVRELANVIERGVILKRTGVLTAADLHVRGRGRSVPKPKLALVEPPKQPVRPTDPAPAPLPELAPTGLVALDSESVEELNLRTALLQVERRLIALALEKSGGNRTEAAALLGLNRTTLVEKMRKLA